MAKSGIPSLLKSPEVTFPVPMLPAAKELLLLRAEGALLVFIEAPRGTIARTPNGKPKRRQLWQAFLAGQLPGNIVAAEPGRRAQTRRDPDV